MLGNLSCDQKALLVIGPRLTVVTQSSLSDVCMSLIYTQWNAFHFVTSKALLAHHAAP